MTLLFFFNVFSYFFIQLVKLRYISRYFKERGGILNPITILYLSQLPIEVCKLIVGPALLLEMGVDDKYYNFSIFITTLSQVIDYILLRLAFLLSDKYRIKSSSLSYLVRPKRMIFVSAFLYLLFFFFLYLLSIHSFGFLNWLSNPRIGYQLHRTGAGQYWVLAISCLSVSFSLAALYIRRYSVLFAVFIFFVISAFFLGSKGIILEFFLFFFIILWLKEYKHLRKMFIIGFPIALFLLLVNFFWGASIDAIEFKEIFSYFDHYVNSARYYRAYFSNEISLFNGKIFLSNYWGIIPRSLYESKPYIYGINHVNEFFWPGAAENTNTPAFAGPVAYFADFGVIGVVLFTLLDPFKFIAYFFLCQLLKGYKFHIISKNPILLSLFILFTSPFFLFSLAFPLNMIFFVLLIILILFFNKITISR